MQLTARGKYPTCVGICDSNVVIWGSQNYAVPVPDIAQESEQEALWEANCNLVAHHTLGHDVRALVQPWR